MLTDKENNPPSALLSKQYKLVAAYVGDDPLAPWLRYLAHRADGSHLTLP